MERIQKALEKAKADRGNIQNSSGSNQMNANSRLPRRDDQLTDGIEYSQTRVVSLPVQTLQKNRIIAAEEGNPHADLFRVLRTKLLHKMREGNLNSLAITSPTKGAGKSNISTNLAIAIAKEMNQTALLVDLDFRRPSLQSYFGLNETKGLADYLLDGVELNEVLVNPGIEGLVLLPAGRAISYSSELLSTPRMLNLIEDITHRYASRMIIFDLPPLLGMDDALTFLPSVHASLLVVEEGVTTKEEIAESLGLLEQSNLLGTVYNKAKSVKPAAY